LHIKTIKKHKKTIDTRIIFLKIAKQRFNRIAKQALSVQNPRSEKGDVKDDIY
jgi:hypothetical protein